MALFENDRKALMYPSSRIADKAVCHAQRGGYWRKGRRAVSVWSGRFVCLIAVLSLLFLSAAANALAPAVSRVSVNCLVLESKSQEGALFGSCLHFEDSFYARAEATAQTFLGTRPGASVAASRSNTPFHFLQPVSASAHLTYEFLLTATAPPPVDVAFVPVNVAVLGQFRRSEALDGNTVAPTSLASAQIFIRSNSTIPLLSADVLREAAIANSGGFPSFDKIVSLSLIPGHIYIVDVVAGCQHNTFGAVQATFSSAGNCSALADPAFSLDQAALDAQLGSESFSLAAFYQFEYSAGVTAIPEPSQAVLLLVGLGGLAMLRRRRSLREGVDIKVSTDRCE